MGLGAHSALRLQQAAVEEERGAERGVLLLDFI